MEEKLITPEQYKKMSPDERKAAMKKEFEDTKDMSLDELYCRLGSYGEMEYMNNECREMVEKYRKSDHSTRKTLSPKDFVNLLQSRK